MKYWPFYIALFATTLSEAALPNLDDKRAEFILEEKEIVIPEYPTAFNPSIIRWENGRLLLSFRARDPLTKMANLIGFVWLNDEFEPIEKPSLLTIYGASPLKNSREQDPRLIQIGQKVFLAYNNILNDEDLETRRMIACELHYRDGNFFIHTPIPILSFEGDSKNWREKNWAPFDFAGTLHFSYSLNPHKVFKLSPNLSHCDTITVNHANLDWRWGEVRGGTPSLLDGNEYFGFFHSFIDMKSVQSGGKKISHYFMGAYRFSKIPPFQLTHISPEPIIGQTFYNPPDYPTWKPLRAIFPAGLIFNDDYVWVVYGRQDHECWVVKLDKHMLLKTLREVSV